MGNLFMSFTIAVCAAVGFVSLSRAYDFESYTTKILPLVPILYAIVYEVLERKKSGKTAKSAPRAKEAPRSKEKDEEIDFPTIRVAGVTPGKVIVDVALSFVAKFSVELLLLALFLQVSGQTFADVYGTFSFETVGKFLRGDHPWLTGKEGIWLLALMAIFTSLVTGSWIGHTSKGNAILEGVFAGAIVTLINSMTNMLILYRTLEEMTVRLADSMGYVMRAGILIVIGLQVLLYGLWSGLVQMRKQERAKKKGKR